MKVPGKVLAIGGGLILIGYVIALKFATPSALVEVKEVPTQSWLVLGKSMEGGLHSREFEEFFKTMDQFRKDMGDSLPELTRYYTEPTVSNKKKTSVFSGLIVPDSSYNRVGYQLIKIKLGSSIKVQHMLGAGLYTAIDDYARTNKIELDKSQVVEILAKNYKAILIEKK